MKLSKKISTLTETPFKSFLKNSCYSWFMWLIFNTTFYMVYLLYNDIFPHHSYIVPTGITMKDILMPVVVVYAILLLLIFFISVFVLKNIGNMFKNACSVLFFRIIEMVLLGIVVMADDRLIWLINWSIATLDYAFSAILGLSEYDLTLLYGVTSFIPFVVMFLGIVIGKKIRAKQTIEN